MVAVGSGEFVRVGTRVLVGVRVTVGVGVTVRVAVGVFVAVGNTKPVAVAGSVEVGRRVAWPPVDAVGVQVGGSTRGVLVEVGSWMGAGSVAGGNGFTAE